MQYLVTEGYKVISIFLILAFYSILTQVFLSQDAAEQFSMETNISPGVELASIGDLTCFIEILSMIIFIAFLHEVIEWIFLC